LDFWDLTALIFRRWKIALPLLMVAVGATAFVALTAKPDYTMTSYVQVVPAKVAASDNAVNAALRNPWNQLGLATLGQASIYATQDQGFLDSLKAGHHTDSFTLTLTYPSPIVTVEVVGKTPEDARETTELVINRLRAAAQSLQKQSGVLDEDIIPTQRLDQGQNLVPSGGKVKRAIAAVAAAGLLLTAGGTVGFDAFLRRRARRRADREAAEPAPETPAGGSTDHDEAPAPALASAPVSAPPKVPVSAPPKVPVSAPPKVPVSAPPKVPVSAPPKVPAARNGFAEAAGGRPQAGVRPEQPATPPARLTSTPAVERTAIVIQRSAHVVKHPPAAKPARAPEAAMYRSVNAQTATNGDDSASPDADNDSAAAPSDVRVVLQPKWLGGENGGKAH
jgi:hypothetical protein